MDVAPIQEELFRLERLLRRCRFRFSNEAALQAQITEALTRLGEPHKREHQLGTVGRIDFLVGRVGVEVKVRGATSEIGWQLLRYAEHQDIDGILLVTAKARHTELPPRMNDKPLRVYHLLQL